MDLATFSLPHRPGAAPRLTVGIPQQQASQNAPEQLQELLFARASALPGVRVEPSAISVPGARAFVLDEAHARGPRSAFITGREFAHIHPAYDGSFHVTVPPQVATEVQAKGWGLHHPLAGDRLSPTMVMLYGPRDAAEAEAVWSVLEAGHAYATGATTGALETLRFVARPADGEPDGVLVAFHGRGNSEHDAAALLDRLDPDRRLLGVAPRGPIDDPAGGAHWYLLPRIGFPDPDSLNATVRLVGAWLDALAAATGLPLARFALAGNSQGATLTHALTLGAGRPRPGAVIGFSGFVPELDAFALELAGREALPVTIAHGTADAVIPVERGRRAVELYRRAGADVLHLETSGGHGADPRSVAQAADRLAATLGRTGEAGSRSTRMAMRSGSADVVHVEAMAAARSTRFPPGR